LIGYFKIYICARGKEKTIYAVNIEKVEIERIVDEISWHDITLFLHLFQPSLHSE